MSTPTTLSLKKIYSGKVRDLYEIDDKRMLMVATDRLSAFDVILEQPIPEKGKILTAISNFWFDKLADVVPNHFTGDKVEDVVSAAELPLVEGRAVEPIFAAGEIGGNKGSDGGVAAGGKINSAAKFCLFKGGVFME